MQDSNRISYVSKDYLAKQIPQLPLEITLKFNLLNLHTAMIDFHQKTINRKIEISTTYR